MSNRVKQARQYCLWAGLTLIPLLGAIAFHWSNSILGPMITG